MATHLHWLNGIVFPFFVILAHFINIRPNSCHFIKSDLNAVQASKSINMDTTCFVCLENVYF